MKPFRAILLCIVIMLCSLTAYAVEFNQNGVHLVLPEGFSERGHPRNYGGHSTHSFARAYGEQGRLIAVLVDMTVLTEEEVRIGRVLTKESDLRASESYLAVTIRSLPMEKPSIQKEPEEIRISNHTAMKVALSGVDTLPQDAPNNGLVRGTLFCIAEPARVVIFHVWAPDDAPKELIDSAIKAIETAQITMP